MAMMKKDAQINILQGKASRFFKVLYNTVICTKRPFLSGPFIQVLLYQ